MRQPVPFGKYLLLDRISVGGMAEVFKAKSYGVEGFEKVIAIKRILPSMCEDQDFIRMFIDEAKIAGQLSHANICQIFELGRVKSAHFIAMEYIWGKDLLQIQNRCRQRNVKVPVEMACFIIAQVCEGLDYAHQKKDALGRPLKIIHRDCSPQNMLLSYEGEVKIIDFGIAKAASRSSRTNAGVLKGKFGYMSPEQVRGLPLDRRSDIFAIGTCLYESLTGQRLFLGESDFSTLERVRNADVIPPRSINGDIPEEVEAVVMKALARDPDDRYQWCGEMRADLQRYLTSRDRAFTAKSLNTWMRDVFGTELTNERKLMEDYKKVGRDGLIAGVPHADAELDVVSELGEAGDPEGDPTVLGGPSIEEMLAEAERRFSAKGKSDGGFGEEGETDVAGEVRSSSSGVPGKLDQLDTNSTIALDDAELDKLAKYHKGPPEMPTDGSGRPASGIQGPPVSYSSSPGTTGQMMYPGMMPSGQFGMTTDTVQPLGMGGYPLPSANHLRRRPSLLRDIIIGVIIAGTVLGLFLVGKKFLIKSGDAEPAGKGALAILAADGEPADVYLNGKQVGRFAEGKALTIQGLAPGDYTIELRRPKADPCVETVKLGDSVEVVSCKFEGVTPETGSLNLIGVTDSHRIFINETEISHQAAIEPIKLEPDRQHLIYVRAEDTVIQEFRVRVAGGEEISRKVAAVPEELVAKAKDKDKARDKDKPRDKDKATTASTKPDKGKDKVVRNDKQDRKRDTKKDDTKKRDSDSKVKKPEVGYLTAKTRPWARVMIDGRDTGKMTPIPPRTKLSLKPGPHRVTFVVDGQRYSYTVRIQAGKTTHLSRSLGN
ncbi:MAG: protein kinase [Deltaproteobacteria bacterium]|nr:protein kinase [Deltaproteobacteria bacterium]